MVTKPYTLALAALLLSCSFAGAWELPYDPDPSLPQPIGDRLDKKLLRWARAAKGEPVPNLRARLSAQLGSNDANIRATMSEALVTMGAPAVKHLFRLPADCASHHKAAVRNAFNIMHRIGPASAEEIIASIDLIDREYLWVLTTFDRKDIPTLLRKKLKSVRDDFLWDVITLLAEAKAVEAVGDLAQLMLNHEWDSVRSQAAYALGEIGAKEAVPSLLQALNDKKAWVVRQASHSLARLHAREAFEPLVKLLDKDPGQIAEYAIDALGELGDARAVEPLRQSQRSGNINITIALARLGQKDAQAELRKSLAQKPDPSIIWALRDIGDTEAIPMILKIVKGLDPAKGGEYEDWDSLTPSIYYLGKLRVKEAVEPLTKLGAAFLPDSRGRGLSNNISYPEIIVYNLGEIGDERAVEFLLSPIETAGLDKYHLLLPGMAANALGKIKSKLAVDRLIKAMAIDDVYLRQNIACALGEIGDKKALPALRNLQIIEKAPWVRDACREAIKKLEAAGN